MIGKFIVIDGPDGVGKTTVAKALQKALMGSIFTREPGGGPASEAIRDLFLEDRGWTGMTELYLLAAGRAQHLSDIIGPSLVEGVHVICDRWTLSTLAYQSMAGAGRVPSGAVVKTMSDVGGIWIPDVTFVLMTDDAVIDERLATEGKDSRFDTDANAQMRVRRFYRNYFGRPGTATCPFDDVSRSFLWVDASRPIDKIVDDMVKVLTAI